MGGKTPNWFPIAGMISGLATLAFFMYVALFQPGPPAFAHIAVMAFGAGLAVTFLGGEAAASGALSLPFLRDNPVAFSASGGIAVFLIVLLLGPLFLPKNAVSKPALEAEGAISQPTEGASVKAHFSASGTVYNATDDVHVWLAIEIDGRIWPKEGHVAIARDGKWHAQVFEDGRPEKFSLSLWAVNEPANVRLHAWLEEGQYRGVFPELKPLPGMRRLARVDQLRITQ